MDGNSSHRQAYGFSCLNFIALANAGAIFSKTLFVKDFPKSLIEGIF